MRITSLLLLILCSFPVRADGLAERFNPSISFDRAFDDEQKPWQEVEALLPAAPQAGNLRAFEVGGGKGHRYYLDQASLSSGQDGVVRYTLVVRTAGGAENVTYEGMRCSDGERKLYAFGRPDGQWSRNRHARWETIDARGAGSHHKELFFHYLCTVDGPGDLAVIRRAMARGGIRRGGD